MAGARSVALIEPSGRGGLSHFTFALAEALVAEGLRVSVVTGLDYELDRRPRRFELVRIFRRLRTNPLRLWREIRRVHAGVVHLQGAAHPELYLPLLLALRALGYRTVYSVHDVEPRQRRWFPASLLRLLLRMPDRVIAHSRHVANRLTLDYGVATERVAVVPHGNYLYLAEPAGGAAGAPASRGPDEAGPVALFFGYILPQKGLDDLVAAFRSVASRMPAARLLVVGESVGSFEPYRRQIRALGLADRVECHLGYVPFEGMASWFASSRVVALPYRSASQSGVLLNAFGAGRPVVATACPGLTEFVQPERTGVVVPVGDPRALADALVRLLADPAACRRMGDAARRWSARELAWSRVAALTREVYETVAPMGRPIRGAVWNHRSG